MKKSNWSIVCPPPSSAISWLNIAPSAYLRAAAHGQADTWSPGRSGGDRHPDWPAEVTALLTKLQSSKPPSSYSAAASELLRRLQFKNDWARVRR